MAFDFEILKGHCICTSAFILSISAIGESHIGHHKSSRFWDR